MNNNHFVEPLDVLILRSNKLFGDAGSYAASQVLPWPSVISGALRSAIMVRDGVNFSDFASGKAAHPALGSYAQPGEFLVADFGLMQRGADGAFETLHRMPADISIAQPQPGSDKPTLRQSKPTQLHPAISSSSRTSAHAVLAEPNRSKSIGNYWLRQKGWQQYLNGEVVSPDNIILSSELWATDTRIGIGLDSTRRSATDGKLFTTEAIVFKPSVGFYARTKNVDLSGIKALRLGGDGRAATLQIAKDFVPASTPLTNIGKSGRLKIVLTSPGIFTGGWLPTGTSDDLRFNLHGVTGTIVCAAVPRAEVISGFDLVKRAPKAAQRVAPAGSVYWLDEVRATEQQLGRLAETGLWPETEHNTQRQSEGFNRIAIAAY